LGYGSGELSESQKAAVEDLAGEFAEANESELPKYIAVEPGMKIKVTQGTKVFEGGASRRLAADEDIPVPEGVKTLGEFAGRVLGSPDKAASLLDNNKDTLKLPEKLPAGAELKVPQRDLTALLAAGSLVLFLLLVSLGFFLKTPPTEAAARGPTEPAA
jgi:hypothetical protein